MASSDVDVRALVAKLRTRPGRGGVRLSYDEAQTVLRMIEHRATIVQRARKRTGRPRASRSAETDERSFHRDRHVIASGGRT